MVFASCVRVYFTSISSIVIVEQIHTLTDQFLEANENTNRCLGKFLFHWSFVWTDEGKKTSFSFSFSFGRYFVLLLSILTQLVYMHFENLFYMKRKKKSISAFLALGHLIFISFRSKGKFFLASHWKLLKGIANRQHHKNVHNNHLALPVANVCFIFHSLLCNLVTHRLAIKKNNATTM